MKIGYARVSTREQNLDLQIKALQEVGCEKILHEKLSGREKERPEFLKMLEIIRPGDTVYVWALDRLGRNLYQVIKTVSEIIDKNVNLIIISQNIDSSSVQGKIFVTVFALLADMEITLRKQSQKAGIEAARSRGVLPGRKPGLSEEAKKKAKQAAKLYISRDPMYSAREICSILKISTRTLYRYLQVMNVDKRS